MANQSTNKKYCSIQCCNKQKIKDGAPSFAAVRANMKKAGEITKCERCGYNKYPSILGIHHKDRNRKNNHRENLEVLCPNCHSIEHLVHVCHGFKE
jgi:5-methylcytosine-specific restriction endonuclease McrA